MEKKYLPSKSKQKHGKSYQKKSRIYHTWITREPTGQPRSVFLGSQAQISEKSVERIINIESRRGTNCGLCT